MAGRQLGRITDFTYVAYKKEKMLKIKAFFSLGHITADVT